MNSLYLPFRGVTKWATQACTIVTTKRAADSTNYNQHGGLQKEQWVANKGRMMPMKRTSKEEEDDDINEEEDCAAVTAAATSDAATAAATAGHHASSTATASDQAESAMATA